MPQIILDSVAAFQALDVRLKWFLFELAVFLLVLTVRKVFPRLWLRFETLSPFTDPGLVLDAFHKAYQALPSMLLSALVPALVTGGSLKAALWGVLMGLAPPIAHELAKWLPFLPYTGELGSVRSDVAKVGKGKVSLPPILPVLVLVVLLVSGCASWKPIARTADGLAEAMCAQFFAEQKPGLSLEDAARQFCATEQDLRPFIDQVLAAKQAAGRAALARQGGAP